MGHITLEETLIPSDIQILILEDQKSIQDKLIRDLKSLGFNGEFKTAETVKTANEMLESNQAELIISDWNLPDGLGMEFLEKARSLKNYDHVPFLVLTTVDNVDNILSAVNKGADAYIVKPWSINDIKTNISFAYSKRSK